MATSYPGAIDAWANPASTTQMDDASYYHDVVHSNELDAIEAIETELGTDPAGAQATVAARLDHAAMAEARWVAWPSGKYIHNARSSTNQTGTMNCGYAVYLTPFWSGLSLTVDRIAIEVTTVQSNAHLRLGLYGTDDATGLPTGSPLATFGEVDGSTTGIKELTVSQALAAGRLYWVGIQSEMLNEAIRSLTSADMYPFYMNSAASGANTTLYQASSYGTGLPDISSLSITQTGHPLFWLRRS